MAAPRLGWIGVDVGTHAVKLAQVVRDSPGAAPRLHRAAVMQRPTSWPTNDRLAFDQPSSSAIEIRAARQCGRFFGRNAVCMLPMNVCQLRGLCVPPGDDAERRSMIADELAQEWEERRVTMEFDFWELETGQADKANDSFNVNMLAITRPWVAQVSRDCRQAGLDCWAVDGAPLAMARAVSLAGLASGRRALAIDWGYSNTTFCVVGDGRPWYTRRAADCGFGRALEAIAKKFDVSLDQAQHLADVHGIPSPAENDSDDHLVAQMAVSEAIGDTLQSLCSQARKTVQFLESQRRHLHPTAIYLLGGGASMRNIEPMLASELQLPVHVWNLLGSSELPSCAAGSRSALFASAAALSALAWRAA